MKKIEMCYSKKIFKIISLISLYLFIALLTCNFNINKASGPPAGVPIPTISNDILNLSLELTFGKLFGDTET